MNYNDVWEAARLAKEFADQHNKSRISNFPPLVIGNPNFTGTEIKLLEEEWKKACSKNKESAMILLGVNQPSQPPDVRNCEICGGDGLVESFFNPENSRYCTACNGTGKL